MRNAIITSYFTSWKQLFVGSVFVFVLSILAALAPQAAFAADPPQLTGVTPNSGLIAGGDTVVLSGLNFSTGSTVAIGGIQATIVNQTDTAITITTPVNNAGTYDVTVTDSEGQSSVLAGAFTYRNPPPVIASITPSRGPVSGGNTVLVDGENLTKGAQFIQVDAGISHACGLTDKGTVYCWGLGNASQLGTGNTGNSRIAVPVRTDGVLAGKRIVAIAAGDIHTLALDSDGKVYAWGTNTAGQLGNGNTTTSSLPVAVTTTGALSGKRIVAIAAGQVHSLALDSEGKAYAWGTNTQGRLGANTTSGAVVTTPMAVFVNGVLNGKRLVDIDAGTHSIAVDSAGVVYTWGYNASGQLGNNTSNATTSYGVPLVVTTAGTPMAGKKIVDVAAGLNHSIAVDDAGAVYTWGYNANGQLGNASTGQQNIPVAVNTTNTPMSEKKIISVSGGISSSFALSDDGIGYGWGANSVGQLGNGTTGSNATKPTQVIASLPFTTLNAAITNNFTCGVSAGEVYCWGLNGNGQGGDGTTDNHNVPTKIDRTNIVNESAINSVLFGDKEGVITGLNGSALAVKPPAETAGFVDVTLNSADGTAIATNAYEYVAPPVLDAVAPNSGIVTGGDTIILSGSNFSTGSAVTIGGSQATIVSQNSTSITVRTPTHSVGVVSVVLTDAFGQTSTLTDSFTYREAPPALVSITPNRGPAMGGQNIVIEGTNFSNVQFITGAGHEHSCAITSGSGKAYCWGFNNRGQLGLGNGVSNQLPAAVQTTGVLANKKLVSIALGALHTTALDSDGQVYSWGMGTYGQLGNGSSADSTSPVRVDTTGVLAGKKVTKIAATNNYTIALADDGRVYGWGYNDAQVLGDGTKENRYTPVLVGSGSAMYNQPIVAIAAGYYYAVAINASGQVYTWGTGIGGNGAASGLMAQPVAASQNGLKFVDIAAGVAHTLAVTDTGDLYAWGANDQGQIGVGNNTPQTLPVKVAGPLNDKKVTKITATTLYSSSAAYTTDNELYTWGDARFGQMADGTTTSRNLPVKVNGQGVLAGKIIKSLSGGGTHLIGQDTNGALYAWGSGTSGKLGNGTSPTNQLTPVLVTTTTMTAGATGSVFRLGGAEVPNTNKTSNTTIQATTPPGQLGFAPLTVINSDGQSYTLENAYEYVAPPTISAISPSSGPVAGGETVYVSGTNFTENTQVRFGSTAATVVYVNATTLLVTVPASATPGAVDVSVRDEFGQTASLTGGYIYKLPAPTITTVAPQYAKMAGGSTITITGTGFVNRAGGGSWYEVRAGDTLATNVTYVTNTRLTAVVPAHNPGAVNLTVGGSYSESAVVQNGVTYLPDAYAFTNTPRSVMATEPTELIIEARDANGDPVVSTSDIVLRLSSTSNTGSFARALSGNQAGWDYDTVVIPAGQSSVSFYYRDASSGTPLIGIKDPLDTTASQQVTIGSQYKILVTGVSNPTQMGTPSSVTIQAVDYQGVPQADFRGTIHFSSNDGAALLPADYTFTSNDRGRKTFINGVTMGTIGSWNLTVTDTSDATIVGSQDDIIVQAPASGTIGKFAFITPLQSFALDQTSGVITVQTQDATGLAIPVGEATTVYFRTSSSTGQFSADGGATWVQAPAAFTIPAGSSYKNVIYRDTTTGTHQLKVSQQAATDFGWQIATQAVVVGVGAPTKLGVDEVSSASIDQWVPIDISLLDNSGNRVTSPDDLLVRVSIQGVAQLSTSADGANPAQSVLPTVGTGEQFVTVWARATSGTEMTITAEDARNVDDQNKYEPATRVIELGEAAPFGVVLSETPEEIVVHTPAAINVSLRDQFGNIVSAVEPTTVALEKTSGDMSFASSSNGPWQSQQTIEIAQGVTTGQAYLRSTTVADAVTIQATSEGLVSDSRPVRVIAGAYAGALRFAPSSPLEVVAGDEQAFTVELLDAYGNPTVASETVEVGFGVSIPEGAQWNGVAAVQPTAPRAGYTVVVPAGQGSASATYQSTKSGGVSLRAYDQSRWTRTCMEYAYPNGPCNLWSAWSNPGTVSHSLLVKAAAPTSYSFTSAPQVITKATSSAPISVEVRDQYNNAAHFDTLTQVALSTSGTGSFASSSSGPFSLTEATFAAGQSSVTFYYKNDQSSPQVGDLLTVSGNGIASVSQRLRVIEGAASRVALDTEGRTTAVAGEVLPVTLRTQTQDEVDVVVLNDTTFTLSSTQGEFSLNETPFVPVTSVTLSAESSQRQLFFRSTVAGPTALSARAASITPIETELAVVSSDFYKLEYTKLPSSNLVEVAKASQSLVATAYDEFGNVVSPNGTTSTSVALSSSKQLGEFSLSTNSGWGSSETAIQPGATTTQPFYYRIGTINQSTGALEDASVLGLQTVSARVSNVLPAEVELNVIGARASRIAITSDAQALRAGQVSQQVTVQLQATDGSPAVAGREQTVNLSSLNLNDDGDFTAARGTDVFTLTPNGDPISSLKIAPGQSTATFYVMPQTAESHRIRVSSAVYTHDNAYINTISTTQPLTVTAGEASNLIFTTTEQTIFPDKTSDAIRIALTDQFGNRTTNDTARTISLESSCDTASFMTIPGGATVTSLTLAAGENEATFYYSSSAASASPCEITIKTTGLADTTQNIVVREPVYALAITSAPQTLAAGQSSGPIIIETRDRFGNTVPTQDPLTITLETSGSQYAVSPARQTIARGDSSTQFTFTYTAEVAAPTSLTLVVRDVNGTIIQTQQAVTIVPGEVEGVIFNPSSLTTIVGDYVPFNLQTVNAYGKRTSATSQLVFNVSTSAGSGAYYQRVNGNYEPVTTATVANGSGQSQTLYYRQTQTTQQLNGPNVPATLSAQRNGMNTGTASATITAKVLGFSTGNFSAQASSYTPMRVTISSPLPTDLTVNLATTGGTGQFYASQNEDEPVATATIQAGATQSEQFYYRQTAPTTLRSERLTASAVNPPMSVREGQVNASFYTTQLSQLVFVSAPSSLEQGQSGAFTVEARDDLGNVVPFTNSGSGYCLYVNSSSASAVITGSANATEGCNDTADKKAIYVGRYQTRVSFSYKDITIGEASVFIANNSGAGGIRADTNFMVTKATTTRVAFERPLYAMVRGDETTIGVRLVSAHDFPVNSIGRTEVTLSSDSPSGRFYDTSSATWTPTLTVVFGPEEYERLDIRYTDSSSAPSASVQATTASLPTAQTTVRFGVGAVGGLIFKQAPSTLQRGEEGSYTVGFVDSFNNEVAASADFCLYSSSTNQTGTIQPVSTNNSCSDVTLPGGVVAKALYVPAGATEASFIYMNTTAGSTALRVSTLPTGGGIEASHAVTVVDGDPVKIGIDPASSILERGGVLTGRAVLYNAYGQEVPATSDVAVRLDGDFIDGSFALAGDGPWSSSLNLIVTSGSSSTSFVYQAGSEHLGTITLTSSVESDTLESSTATIDMVVGQVAAVRFVTPERTTVATHPSQEIIVEAQNRYGVATNVDTDLQLYVRSDSSTGVFAASSAGPWGLSAIKILAGQSNASFYYRDASTGSHALTVRDKLSPEEGEEYLIATQQHNIVSQVFSHFIVTNISSPTRTGVASSAVVFAVDSENYVVAGYDGTIRFSSDDTTAILPAQQYTFRPEIDKGIHTFNNAIAFKTPGLKTVAVTDENGRQGTQFDIEVLLGNSAPIRSVEFVDSDQTPSLAQNEPSDNLALQLRDGAGALTNAPAGGMPLRVTSSSPTGEFSIDGSTWLSQGILTVEEGLSFSTTPLYYRDPTSGTHTLTVSDWAGGVDSELISNGEKQITINTIGLSIDQEIYSVDYSGEPIKNPYLFSRNKSGEVAGFVRVQGSAFASESNTPLSANWSVSVGGDTKLIPASAQLSYQSPSLVSSAGGANFLTTVTASTSNRSAQWQSVVPVSSWRAEIGEIVSDDTVLTGSLSSFDSDQAKDSPQATVKVIGGVNQVLRTWQLSTLLANGLAQQTSEGTYAFRVPLRIFSGGTYTVVAQLSDGNGVIAQDARDFTVTVSQIPSIPSGPAEGTGAGGGTGSISPETPGDTSSRPETEQPAPPREGAYEQPPVGLVTRILRSPETPVRVAQSLLGVLILIALVLLYQMYREWRHARFLMAIIRRDNETLAHKDAFLQLASHHLRTPLTLLASSVDLVRSMSSDAAKSVNENVSTVISGLRLKVESIIARTETSDAVAMASITPNETAARRRIYLSPVFWLPVILSVILTLALNWAVQTYGGQSLSTGTIANQIVLITVGAILLYTAVRMLAQRKQRTEVLKQSQEKVRALNEAKVTFARQVGRELTDDIIHLNAYIQQLHPLVIEQIQQPLAEGAERLERLVARLSLLDAVYASKENVSLANMEQVVNDALTHARQQNPSLSVAREDSLSSIKTHRSSWFVSRLMQDIFTSLAPLAGSGVIKVDEQRGAKTTKLVITGPSINDLPAEDLFSVYSRSDQEAAGTYSVAESDNRMHRLDLYLDRIIADELQATLSAEKVGRQTQVTLELPKI